MDLSTRLALALISRLRGRSLVALCRERLGFQIDVEQALAISGALRRHARPALLVFGVGRDSLFWSAMNRSGETLFIEDDDRWSEPRVAMVRARYFTRVERFREEILLGEKLLLELPRRRWDAILVDGPRGYERDHPGRLQSIYTASALAHPGARIFVHDAERELESAAIEAFLGRPERSIPGSFGRLDEFVAQKMKQPFAP
jgi:hypothetical protein